MSDPLLDPADFVVENGTSFQVDARVYTSPALFELEMRHLFERGWVCLGHESLVATAGSFFTATLGRQPVIVSREADEGPVRVLFNRCRHRGATVCQENSGTTKYFRCGYHGWVYDLTGKLTGLPQRSPNYEPGFGTSLGLCEVPRIEVRHGFVFASLAASGRTLADQLGHADEYLEAFSRFGRPDTAPIDVGIGVSRIRYDGNWKLQLENSVDSYHQDFVHRSQADLIRRRRGKAITRTEVHDELLTWDLGNGHGALDLTPGGVKAAGVAGKFFQGPGFHISIFPNLCLLPSQVRIIRPLAVDRTLVEAYPVVLKDMEPEQVTRRMRAYEEFYGPAGFGAPDDCEMFERVQLGVMADTDVETLRWMDLSRGLAYEQDDGEGRRKSRFSDESPQRAIYRGWKQALADAVRG